MSKEILDSHWNHRLMVFEEEHDGKKEKYFEMCEVYYKKGIPSGHSSACIMGNCVQDVKDALETMQRCLEKPILWQGDKFPQEYEES